MRFIGLCGGSGSGKSYISSLFASYGIPSVNADEVYHDITSIAGECTLELADEFGDGILTDTGALDRRALSSLIFSNSDPKPYLSRLNSITHKYVKREMLKIAAQYEMDGAESVIFDAPLLFEAGMERDCDLVIAVVANRETRIERIMTRDGITREAAERRINSQHSDEWLRERADIVIVNDSTKSLSEQISLVAKRIKNKNLEI